MPKWMYLLLVDVLYLGRLSVPLWRMRHAALLLHSANRSVWRALPEQPI